MLLALLVLERLSIELVGALELGHAGLGAEVSACVGCKLGRHLLVFEELGEDLQALLFLVNCEEVTDLQDLLLYFLVRGVIEDEARLEGLNLLFQEAESLRV